MVEEASVELAPGLNIVSGETGAGKSVLIEAIGLLLGARASVEMIRAGFEEAQVEGLFQVGRAPSIVAKLRKHSVPADGGEMLIRRSFSRSGRARITINSEIVTLSMLSEITDGLVDFCGQHEGQSLSKAGVQLSTLDEFAGHPDISSSYFDAYSYHRGLLKERDSLRAFVTENREGSEAAERSAADLLSAAIRPEEEPRLTREKALLQSAEKRGALAHAAANRLDEEDVGALAQLRSALVGLKHLSEEDPGARGAFEGLDCAIGGVEAVSAALERYLASIESDPNALDAIQARLSTLAAIRRKHAVELDEVPALIEKLRSTRESFLLAEVRLAETEESLSEAAGLLLERGAALSESRAEAAGILGREVSSELADLRMEGAALEIRLERRPSIEEWSESGPDAVTYLIRTNDGEEARPIAKIASGGELSRVMLATRRVVGSRGGVGIYLFDEVDSGMSGQAAFEVGRKLKAVSRGGQVICITHLPQVTAFGDHNIRVRKSTSGGRARAWIEALDSSGRAEEVARMMGAERALESSLKAARDLIQAATAPDSMPKRRAAAQPSEKRPSRAPSAGISRSRAGSPC